MGRRLLSSDEVKIIENEMLAYLKDVCQSYGLQFCLAYGTLLGAARHHGFIPWDDDVDVFMPRDDYERLYRIYQEGGIDDNYAIRCYRDETSYHPHFKFVNSHTFCRESYINSRFSIGLWIDIFPLDSCCIKNKDDMHKMTSASRKNGYLRQLLGLSVGDPKNGTSIKVKVIKQLLRPLSWVLDPIAISRMIDGSAKRISSSTANGKTTHFAAMTESSASDKQIFDQSIFMPFDELPFEGVAYPVPGDYEAFLTQNYGDWKTLPPESERHSHFTTAYVSDCQYTSA